MIYLVQSDPKDFKYIANRVMKPKSFENQDFYDSYVAWQHQKNRTYTVPDKKELKAILYKFFENAAEAMIEKEAGVMLEGIGYFVHTIAAEKQIKDLKRVWKKPIQAFYETGYHNYFPHMFTGVTKGLEGWTMDKMFEPKIKESFNLNRQPKRCYYEELKSIYNPTL